MIPVTIFAFSWMLWFFFIDWFYTVAIFVVWFVWKVWYNERDREQHKQWAIEKAANKAALKKYNESDEGKRITALRKTFKPKDYY